MDKARARELLANERARLERLLRTEMAATAPDTGDDVDDANWRIAEETGRAVSRSLRDRWSALERAEERLERGTYGRSIVSGREIPEERLEADPLAELLVEEAAVEAFRARRSAENISGLSSTRRTLAALAERDERDTRTTTRSGRKGAASEPEADAEDSAEEDLDVDELEEGEPLDEDEHETPEDFDGDEELADELDDDDADEDEDEEADGAVAETTEPHDSGESEARPPRRRRSGRE
jgi:DnaK suppressor protein